MKKRSLPKDLIVTILALLLWAGNIPALSAQEENVPSTEQERHEGIASKYKDRFKPIPMRLLPKDRYGLVDWARAVREGIIAPLGSIDGKGEEKFLDTPVIIKSKKPMMTDVLFPHSTHTYWLGCELCHPRFFPMKKGQTKGLTMWAIFKGKFCGHCHGKVAFPLRTCYRCHMKRQVMIEQEAAESPFEQKKPEEK